MIPTKEKIEESGNLPGKEVLATIGDPRMVMKSLTKLYSNTALATIREYSTNARDANVEAGRSDIPIEVTLPSVMNPYFYVKDSGNGLDQQELEEVYISYGTSTKRESNLYNGYLGYGSKSALAYTNTFTVTSIKDGRKYIAIITRKEDYSVGLRVISTSKTEEPSGVTIKVPVQESRAFSQIARDFYRFWLPGTILVDGEEPEQAVGEKIGDNLYYSKEQNTSYVVMGNVGYRIENPAALFKKTNAVSFVAYVPNGSVEFTPSREDLEYSNATKETLHEVIDNFEVALYKQGKKEIESKTDPFEAYGVWLEWSQRLGYNMFKEVTFNGETFKDKVSYGKGIRFKTSTSGYGRRYNTEEIFEKWSPLLVSSVNAGLLIEEFPSEKLHSAHKTKIRDWLGLQGMSAPFVYLIRGKNDNQWVNKARVVNWEKLKSDLPKKPKQPRLYGGTGRIPGSFDYWDQDRKWHGGAELPENVKNVYWISVQEEKEVSVNGLINYLKYKKVLKDEFAVVKLQANRIEKFQRDNPKCKKIMDIAHKYAVKDGASLLSEEAKKAMWLKNSTWGPVLQRFGKKDVVDPEWAAHVDMLANERALMLDYEQAQAFMVAIGKRWEFIIYRPVEFKLPFADRYPLLNECLRGRNFSYSSSLQSEWIFYMNDAYRRKVSKSV